MSSSSDAVHARLCDNIIPLLASLAAVDFFIDKKVIESQLYERIQFKQFKRRAEETPCGSLGTLDRLASRCLWLRGCLGVE